MKTLLAIAALCVSAHAHSALVTVDDFCAAGDVMACTEIVPEGHLVEQADYERGCAEGFAYYCASLMTITSPQHYIKYIEQGERTGKIFFSRENTSPTIDTSTMPWPNATWTMCTSENGKMDIILTTAHGRIQEVTIYNTEKKMIVAQGAPFPHMSSIIPRTYIAFAYKDRLLGVMYDFMLENGYYDVELSPGPNQKVKTRGKCKGLNYGPAH
jgi:hypothetical protein